MAPDTEHFIKIPGTETTISPTQKFNGFNYDRTHFKSAENGLYISTSFEFFTHRNNVILAYNGKSELSYSTGEKVPGNKVKEIYHILLNDCWTWLNGRFVKGSGFMNLDLETVVDVEDKKLITKVEPLKKCIDKNCYVDLRFNKQGFPKNISKKQELIREKNVEYNFPVENAVAGFIASLVWAYLDCSRDPQFSSEALGVFSCARGTQKISELKYTPKQISKAFEELGSVSLTDLNFSRLKEQLMKNLRK